MGTEETGIEKPEHFDAVNHGYATCASLLEALPAVPVQRHTIEHWHREQN